VKDSIQAELNKAWRILLKLRDEQYLRDVAEHCRAYTALHDPHTKCVWGGIADQTGGSGRESTARDPNRATQHGGG